MPDNTVPAITVPASTVPDNTTPASTVPDKTAPADTVPGNNQRDLAPPTYDSVWETVERLRAWLDSHNRRTGQEALLLRVLKLSEEVGEVAEAVIGATGQNPRKGQSHSWQDVESELCDVVVTALVALRTLTPDAPDVLAAHLRRVAERSLAS